MTIFWYFILEMQLFNIIYMPNASKSNLWTEQGTEKNSNSWSLFIYIFLMRYDMWKHDCLKERWKKVILLTCIYHALSEYGEMWSTRYNNSHKFLLKLKSNHIDVNKSIFFAPKSMISDTHRQEMKRSERNDIVIYFFQMGIN